MADVLYLCDKKACDECSYPKCEYTSDVTHAVNFENKYGVYIEKNGEGEADAL